MANYPKLARTALRLIEKNGRDVTFTLKSNTPADTDAPWEGRDESGDDSFTALSVVVPFEKEEVDGTVVRAGDSRMFVAANSVLGKDMKSVDTADDRGELWQVVQVNEITPGPIDVLFELRLRA